ncbi:MAG: ABC transporter permease [Bacteroidota bacterium]
MFSNYLKIAVRQALKNRAYALINIGGLAIGIACCTLILLFVTDEIGYDRYHENADRIYRVTEIIESEETGERSSSLPFPVSEALLTDYPDLVESSVRFFNFQAPTLSLENREKELAFNERRLFFADAGVFEVFSFELLRGDPKTALAEPNSIILTESMVQKYFEGEDPLGKVLRFQGERDLKVTGVLKDVRPASHFRFDFLASFRTLDSYYNTPTNTAMQGWYWNPCWTYLLLKDGVVPEELASQFPTFVQKYFPEVIKHDVTLQMQPLTDIHLTSRLDYEIEPNASEENVYMLSVAGFFVLLIACINFMNLATARAVQRAREVGLRKTLGGDRRQLILQFLFESNLYSYAAIVAALAIVELSIPQFNALTGKSIDHGFWYSIPFLFTLLTFGAVVGLGAGAYPALVLSSFQPARVLKSGSIRFQGLDFRKLLVVLQFAISVILIVGTWVAISQLQFLQKSDLGFQKDHIVMLPALRSSMANQYEAFKETILRHPSIRSVTALEEVLGAKFQGGNYRFEGMDVSRLFNRLNVRHDFTKTFNVPLAAGRDYDESFETDDASALVVNEALVRNLGWKSNEEAVGKRVGASGRTQIVGVVKDFNFASKHQPIAPLVLDLNLNPGAFNLFIKYVAVRYDPLQTAEALQTIREAWNRMIPDKPFEYFYLDQDLQKLYESEERLTAVASIFAFLAILVACLGLFGHATHMVQRRTKEIGIRKTLGASVPAMVGLLSKDSLVLLIPAILVSWPVSWLIMNRWLGSFAYRVEISMWVFVISGLAVVAIAILTISVQTIKAALSDPTMALKCE